MKHTDLGVLEGDLLLFGGPYGNFQATEAIFAQAAQRAISADHVICTGDVVAYCGAPAATVDAVRTSGCIVLAGNCEVQIAQNADDCGCGFEEGTACDRLSVAWYAYARTQLNADARAWMAALPDVLSFVHHGKRYGVVHGGATDVARFVWETDSDAVFEEEWEALEAITGPIDVVISGHSGLSFLRDTPRGNWVNAGVIGMPPHNGDQHTGFAVLSGGAFESIPLSYDVEGAVADMAAAKLPMDYAVGLQTGYWPSEDVLPESLRVAVSDRG